MSDLKGGDLMSTITHQSGVFEYFTGTEIVKKEETFQTHTSVNVNASSWSSPSAWIDTQNFSKIGLTFAFNASIDNELLVQWSHDALNIQGEEPSLIPKMVARFRAGKFDTKARYVRVLIKNNDASARTLNSWLYLQQ